MRNNVAKKETGALTQEVSLPRSLFEGVLTSNLCHLKLLPDYTVTLYRVIIRFYL